MLTAREILERQIFVVRETVETIHADAWAPTACIHTVTDRMAPMQLPEMPPTHEARRAMFGLLGAFAAEEIPEEITYLSVIAEAWGATIDKTVEGDEPWENDDFVKPEDRPDREEVMVIDVISADGSVIGAILPIIRDPQGKIRLGEPRMQSADADCADDGIESPMTELFFPAYHAAKEKGTAN